MANANQPTVGFLGAGQMAQALVTGFQESGLLNSAQVCFFDPLDSACESFRACAQDAQRIEQPERLAEGLELLFLAVKPQRWSEASAPLKGHLSKTVVVSIMAGIPMTRLAESLATNRLIRVMPNTPCLIGRGVAGISADPSVDGEQVDRVRTLMESVAICEVVTETQLDVVTGLSGSGPAYVFLMLEALIDGAVRMGLPRDVATRFALGTVIGAGELAAQSESHVAELRDRVTSPGGTTAAGLHALEEGSFRATIHNAVAAATERASQLGEQ